jgi:Glycerol kinase
MRYLLALDQGTTSSRALLFDEDGRLVGMAQREFAQLFPQPGWVEHDPLEIWETQIGVAREVLLQSGVDPRQVAAIGITNQRETTVVWERKSGRPIYNAIVWQDRRTAPICDAIKSDADLSDHIRARTGLVVDAYFSAPR